MILKLVRILNEKRLKTQMDKNFSSKNIELALLRNDLIIIELFWVTFHVINEYFTKNVSCLSYVECTEVLYIQRFDD